jgi:hypothetical protein
VTATTWITAMVGETPAPDVRMTAAKGYASSQSTGRLARA